MRRRPLLATLAATAGATLQTAAVWSPGADAQTLPPRALHVPPVLAQAAFLLDVETGAALFQKFPDARRPMASTTKLMTALLAVESGRLDEVVTVSRVAATVGETSMGLYEGERVSLRDLLFGLLMNSGNDAAIAIAEHLAGSIDGFSSKMNDRAAALGLANTRYVNPHGLDHAGYYSPNHFSSARDLARLCALALTDPALAEADGTLLKEVPAGPGRSPHRLRHAVSALWWYPGTIGGKTGFTGRAGQVRVTAAERAGTRLVAVVMDSPDHVGETRDLLDYGFALASRAESRLTVPVGPEALASPDRRIDETWRSFKRLALGPDGRIAFSSAGPATGTAFAQGAALLHAVWARDRAAFDSIWSWTTLALSRDVDHPANPKKVALFASRWSAGAVTDWTSSPAADQRIAAGLLLASRLWNEPAYYEAAVKVLDAILEHGAISWDVRGVPASGWSITAANTFLKELEPVTTSAEALTPAFYRMFAEAGRSSVWLWLLDGAYRTLTRAAAGDGPLGASVGLVPGWFSVSRSGLIGAPVDPTWQSTGFSAESARLVWQLGLDWRWNADPRATQLLEPTARHLSRELAQRGRVAQGYMRNGQPVGGVTAAAATETALYGALSGISLIDPSTVPSLEGRLTAAVASGDAVRLLDALDGFWLLAGGPPNLWRIWNPPPDVPTTRNDSVVPPADGYPWRYFQETGHTVQGELLQFFADSGGVDALGAPLTDEVVENGKTVQYFQRAVIGHAPGEGFDAAPLPEDTLKNKGWLK